VVPLEEDEEFTSVELAEALPVLVNGFWVTGAWVLGFWLVFELMFGS
jgi:hypothetical protein